MYMKKISFKLIFSVFLVIVACKMQEIVVEVEAAACSSDEECVGAVDCGGARVVCVENNCGCEITGEAHQIQCQYSPSTKKEDSSRLHCISENANK
ncbi:hypothetical protein ACOSQ2_018129 [Xanthoceras sorbifolium]